LEIGIIPLRILGSELSLIYKKRYELHKDGDWRESMHWKAAMLGAPTFGGE